MGGTGEISFSCRLHYVKEEERSKAANLGTAMLSHTINLSSVVPSISVNDYYTKERIECL